ncbi:MAG: FAD-binding protein [Betaproteobacteria bacterium]
MKVDVAILGAGAAGMFVALAAGARGLRVAVFEPQFEKANNLAISGSLFPAAGSALQIAAGIQDSPEVWLEDLRRFAPGMVNERIAESVAHALPEATAFLMRSDAAAFRFLPDMVAPGHSCRRFHSVDPASGAALHAWFRRALEAAPGIDVLPYRAQVERASGTFVLCSEQARLEAVQVVLAGGGFAGDRGLVARFIPGMGEALHNGSATNDGSVLQIGLQWGAQVWGMDGYQGQGHTNPGGATRLGMSIPSLGGVMVNREGLRFVAEDIGPSALAPYVLAQSGGVALEVFDAAIESQLGNHWAYQQAVAAGCVMTAQSVEALATHAGIDAAALTATLEQARACAEGMHDPLGRRRFARVLTAPFKASWVTGALSHTQGGLLTDVNGAVIGANEQPLGGIFAAGGCAAGLSGRGAEGYLPGNGLAQAFGLGWRVSQALG